METLSIKKHYVAEQFGSYFLPPQESEYPSPVCALRSGVSEVRVNRAVAEFVEINRPGIVAKGHLKTVRARPRGIVFALYLE
jgi:hypothetical protein